MEQISAALPNRAEETLASQAKTGSVLTGIISTGIAREPSILYHVSKRILDILLSFFGIVLLIPVFLIIAIYIKLDDGGDILHFREIVGLHGRRFYALKFRTMRQDADAYLARHPELMRKYLQNMKLDRDPRITKVGRFLRKTSLDGWTNVSRRAAHYPSKRTTTLWRMVTETTVCQTRYYWLVANQWTPAHQL